MGFFGSKRALISPQQPGCSLPGAGSAVASKNPPGRAADGQRDLEKGAASPELSGGTDSRASTANSSLVDSEAQPQPQPAFVSAIVGGLGAMGMARLLAAVEELVELLDGPERERTSWACQKLRAADMLPLLVKVLRHSEPYVRQKALMALGNMCSESVDAESKATRMQLRRLPVVGPLLVALAGADAVSQVYAAAAMQNASRDVEIAKALIQARCRPADGPFPRRLAAPGHWARRYSRPSYTGHGEFF